MFSTVFFCTHRLAAHICGYSTVALAISGSYGMSAFREDLARFVRRAGVKGEGLLFLLIDTQIVDERMCVYLNDLMASGEVPDLFAQVGAGVGGVDGVGGWAGAHETRRMQGQIGLECGIEEGLF